MNKIISSLAMAALFVCSLPIRLQAQQITNVKKVLSQEYNLVPQHSNDTQYYKMESRLQKFGPDGTSRGIDIYRLFLRCVPSASALKGDKYTCMKFTLQIDSAAETTIPVLTDWVYFFSINSDGNNGPMFGIDPGKFEKLKDENDKLLQVENTYHAYNAFIDFHTMSVFAEKTRGDSGVQDLKKIGDKIVHAASFSKPGVPPGLRVREGSYFKNGKITLSFKGLGMANDKASAILEYDSGESSFHMVTKPMANMDVTTNGRSHYWGDIYKDLSGGWIQKAVLHEVVVSDAAVPGMNNIHSVIERSITIQNVKRLDF